MFWKRLTAAEHREIFCARMHDGADLTLLYEKKRKFWWATTIAQMRLSTQSVTRDKNVAMMVAHAKLNCYY